ncbi:hypothetical protein F2P58_23440 [Vibrio fortis]|uniref:DUF3168 domain-containing protein n=1 Tax=Vibrio fortis TaxID=212667 RepID=A0A5N3QVE5_9VIBR|nr:hypothetical protein F2P58_23440 [Vibrio fortis]
MKGYVENKPEGTPYPAFVVSSSMSRGEDIYDNNGKPFGYDYTVQINLIDSKYRPIRVLRDKVLAYLDGFRGDLEGFDVIDCRLNTSSLTMSLNKNYEAVLFFSLSTK